jgi:aspartate aminotransferase
MEEALQDFRLSSQVFPAGLPELKDKLSAHYRDRYGVEIPSRRFIIGAGTSTIFRNLFHLLLNHEDEVLLPSPYYSLYRFSALLTGAKIRYYRIDPNTMKVDMQSFRDNVTPRTRVVVVNSPGNPLGNIVARDEMLEMDAVVNGQAVIIHDEIYANMHFDTESFSSVQLGKTRTVFITTNAFSKGYRMYARRVGYCIVPESLIEPLTVIQHHTMLTVDPVVQYGAAAALDLPEEVEKLAGLYKERRDYTVERFESVPDVTVIPSYGGFYLVLDCSSYMERHGIVTSLELATRIIQSTLVATVPGSDFGMPECLRLSFSSSKYKEGIDRLAAFFTE